MNNKEMIQFLRLQDLDGRYSPANSQGGAGMRQTDEEKRWTALRRANSWLQEMVRQGFILSEHDQRDREYVRLISEWYRVLLEHDRPLIAKEETK